MRKFQIVVNGTSYEVEVEEIGAGASAAPIPAAPAAPAAVAPAPKAAPAPAAKPAAAPAPKAAPAGAETIKAPMPGTIMDIKVSGGQWVKKGDVLLILEAMKMENEGMAPRDGVVASVMTSKGAQVNSGDALVALQ